MMTMPSRVFLVIGIFVLALIVSPPAIYFHWFHHHKPCTWGASSITATKVHGRLIISKPDVTGCKL